ncbi:META domain-containing protein [Actinoplanes sp. NBC_00393]|uniref:META domain-containing protein n=1 Tax=Actinoplanes sp. NBC_00393 TaxID=2975953 RepID=UPI002E1BB1D0
MTLMGQWYANTDGQFVADLNAFSSHPDEKGCASVKEPADTAEVVPEWLARAAAFRAEGGERLLLDRDGGTVARLQPGAKPVKRSTMASEVTGVPVVTDETRAELNAVAAPLPANLTAATSATLLGKWKPDPMPQGTQEPGPFAEFLADGKWTGSDGCNGQGGRWLSGPNGSLLATQGPMTLIGCAGAPIGQWMTEARRAGFDGQTLVLLDGAGKEVGRLVE